MRLPTRVGLLAGASALAATGASFADNNEAQDQAARIAELESQVARLTGDDWLTEERAEEIRGVVQDVLADADTRASLLQSGMSAGYDDGFVIGSSDGNFSLKMNGQLQARFIYNNQGDDTLIVPGTPPDLIENTDDKDRWGFENTRTKLIFSGNVAGPQWGYFVEGNFAREGGSFDLEDAYVVYDAGNGWSLTMGQFKQPLNREFLVHSSDQLLVERSNISYLYNQGRTQGVKVGYASDQWRMHMAPMNDGVATANTAWSTRDYEWSFTGRFEFMFMGNWGQFDDFTSPRGSEQGLMVGVGFHGSLEEKGSADRNELQTYIVTADVSWEADGWNVFGSISYADLDNDASGTDEVDFNPLGVVVHGGYYFTDQFEGYARYEFNDFDDLGLEGVDIDDYSLLTVGVNHYYNDNVKASADIGYAFDPITLGGTDVTGQRFDAAGDDGQLIFRTQLQLTF